MLDIIFQALTKTNIENTELVTIYYAAEAQAIEAEDIAQKIREGYRLEVEVVQGGQPHYNYIISLE